MGFVLVGSDYHFGSRFASFPEGFRTSSDHILPLNRGQDYLNECMEYVLKVTPPQYDLFVVNGDGIDGDNKFNMARHLSEVDPLWQVRGGEIQLQPFVDRASRVRYTRGSTYHTGKGGMGDELLAERVKADPLKGYYAPPWWRFWYGEEGDNGVYFDVAHRQSVTTVNHSMPLERELRYAELRFARKRLPVPKHLVIIRSHVHWGFGVWRERDAVVISTPCMKLQDDFAKTLTSPNRIIPDNVGMVGIRINDEPVDGEKVTVIPYLFDHPDEEDVDVIG